MFSKCDPVNAMLFHNERNQQCDSIMQYVVVLKVGSFAISIHVLF